MVHEISFFLFLDEVVLQCDVIFLAMKPQFLDEVLKELRIRPDEWTFSKLVVSLLAGLTCETLHEVHPSYLILKNTVMIILIESSKKL